MKKFFIARPLFYLLSLSLGLSLYVSLNSPAYAFIRLFGPSKPSSLVRGKEGDIPSAFSELKYSYQLIGAQGEILKNISSRLNQEQAQYPKFSRVEIHRLYQQTPGFIQEAVQPFGYFKSKIYKELNQQDNIWTAHYTIELGPALKINSLKPNIIGEGRNNSIIKQYLADFPLHRGDIFSAKPYNQAKQGLIDRAVQQSYVTAHYIQSQVLIDLPHYKADIILDLETGPRYFFGPAYFSPTHFNPGFLNRFLNYKVGEPYNLAKLRDLQQRFYDSSYFQEIEVTPHLEKAKNQQVPIAIKLKPTKSKEYLVGVGYGTDTGVRGQLSFKLPQFGNNGEQVKGLIKASPEYSKLITSYSIPGADPVNSHYTMSASLERQNQSIGKSTTTALIASYVSRLKNNWEQTLGLNLINDRSTIANENNMASNLLLFPSISWLKLKTDNTLNPSEGYRLLMSVLGTPEKVISSMDFLQAQINGKMVKPLSANNRLVLHAALGHTKVSDLARLPLSLRFYTGGSQSIRGYTYKSIGPGRELIEASAEFQHRLYKSLYAGIFYDAGNASDSLLPSLKKSVGVGLVFLSPIGTVQLSVAKALDAKGKPLRIQFNMGPDL